MFMNQPLYDFLDYSTEINRILSGALNAVDPGQCVKKEISRKNSILFIKNHEIDLHSLHKIYVIGVGKAVIPMASAITEVLGDLISEGVLIAKHADNGIRSKMPGQIQVLIGSHPIPSGNSIKATTAMFNMLKMTTPDDLVIGLISGGGSALMTYPAKTIGLSGLQKTTTLLLKCGATIEEMNTIRKHLDLIKGGGLLKHIYPAKSVHLILSDVLGDPLSMIASGPTSVDPTTYDDCLMIIQKYKISKQMDKTVMEYLQKGAEGQIEETIKDRNPIIYDHSNFIVGSLRIAAEAASVCAKEAGFDSRIITTSLRGEARIVGSKLAEQLVKVSREKNSNAKPVCLIAGGETTVTVSGKGKGGRNQEMALAAAQILRGINNCVFVTFATDGEDGPTDAAGGYITGKTFQVGLEKGLVFQNYLNDNNAYEYLEKTGSLVKTGPTGTNVNDLVLMFAF